METYHFDSIGLAHFIFAIVSMLSGAAIVFMKKGTKIHTYIGYVYVAGMAGLNATALMIYKLFGHFGPFHFFALLSLFTVVAGLVPAFRKKPRGLWLEYHYEWMSWSVVGLYAAFWSETFTRFFSFGNMTYFWLLVGGATAMTVGLGYYFIKGRKTLILSRFNPKLFGEKGSS